MTQWQEFALRPQGRPWPGLNTRGGALDNGTGQLEDGSVNQIIGEADILQKRKGIVRGLEERFVGVVCGLFKYTDDCGVEWLLVADEEGISIRQPFTVPVFENSDAYPFDSFPTSGAGVGDVDPENWRNLARYTQRDDKLVEVLGNAEMSGPELLGPESLRWFKDASNLSYQVRIQYEFQDTNASEQHQAIIIKGRGDLSSGSYLQAELIFVAGSTYQLKLYHRDASGALLQVGQTDLTGLSTGFLTLSYTRDLAAQTFTISALAQPLTGLQTELTGNLNALQDAALGQTSAIALGHRLGDLPQNAGILVVDGGPV